MKSSELVRCLDVDGGIPKLKQKMAVSIKEFSYGLRVKGGSAPISLAIENKEVLVEVIHVKSLCKAYLDGTIDAMELEYVASALDICPDFKFVTDNLREIIRNLSELHQMEPSEIPVFVKGILQSREIGEIETG